MDHELKEILSAIVQRLDNMDARFDGIDKRFDGIDSRLESIELEQVQMKQAIMETNQTVKQIEKNQDKQQHLIELLSFRSIELESEIKKLKISNL